MIKRDLDLLKAYLEKSGEEAEVIIYGIKVSKTGLVTKRNGKNIDKGFVVNNIFAGQVKQTLLKPGK